MKAVIVCNGSIRDYSYMKGYFDNAGLIVCADGGAAHLRRFDVVPHVLLGDFDSIDEEDLRCFEAKGVEIVNFPAEKDMTDTELAVELAVGRGSRTVIILGGVGNRLDHSLSNVFLLKKLLDIGVKGIIADESNEITIINDSIELDREENITVSLLPLSERVEGVTTRGLYYPLKDATMELGSTWGVSNKFSESTACVAIKKGLLLVIKSREDKKEP
ncbi:MAG: thiamine diphosphokinase [Clostridia bacterium]|nr:thiamine diphosphokinase [Clostridia bacterium]